MSLAGLRAVLKMPFIAFEPAGISAWLAPAGGVSGREQSQ